jgi:N-acyl-D-aspartate/D-glutamate deacylase
MSIAAFLLVTRGGEAQEFDVVIRNGRVIDPESGLDAVRTLGIRNGRIASITEGVLRGTTIIDAKGLVVAPGFIDLHRHAHGDNSYKFQVLMA